jgi:uncharacterized membrane protein
MQPIRVSAGSGEGLAALAVLAAIAAVISAIFWMVVGWRAMRAHERIADATEQAIQKLRIGDK